MKYLSRSNPAKKDGGGFVDKFAEGDALAIKTFKAIRNINPSARSNCLYNAAGDGINIEWLNGTTPISQSDIDAKIAEMDAVYAAVAYKDAREYDYPSVNEFIEAYTEKEIDGDSTKWDAYVIKRNKVKTDNPKP